MKNMLLAKRWDDFKCFIAFHLIVVRQRIQYYKIIRRIRKYPANRKIRVLFWVSSTSKWKTQSLYEKMAASDRYDPVVGLGVGLDDVRILKNSKGIDERLKKDQAFYEHLGDRYVRMYDTVNDCAIPLSTQSPDIVFFQEPKMFFPVHEPRVISKTALCCYMPYSIKQNGAYMSYLIDPSFHSLMYLRVALNDDDARFVRRGLPWYNRSGKILGLGHTILDEFNRNNQAVFGKDQYTIYAPHFSFPAKNVKRPITLSAFLTMGKPMLEYAKAHPELNWIFKPHPKLRSELVGVGGWTDEEVREYYSQWEKLGRGYYDGDYIRLFVNARALITDCGSFLSEFSATGMPVIRMIPKELNFPVRPAFRELFSSFYEVRTHEELTRVLREVLECGVDNRRRERLAAAQKLGLMHSNAAERILAFFNNQFGVK